MKRIVFILLLVTLIFSCDLFNASLDPDYWERIDVEIAYANAPLINVQVSSGGMGTASPSGSQQVKLWQEAFSKYGYAPFTVSYQPFSQYPFTGWQAWYSGQEPFATWKPGTEEDGLPEEEGQDKVEFKSADETGTHIFIYINKLPEEEGIIHIGPLGADTEGIEVRTLADTRWGTVFTAPTISTKEGFPFNVEFAASSSWDFLGWKAYAYNDQSADNLSPDTLGAELSAEEVSIEVTGIGRAVVTVNTEAEVLLVPLCVTPVRVNFSTPPNGSLTEYAPSQVISITFSTQLDPSTVKFGEGFIQITEQSGEAPSDITAHYQEPVYNDDMRIVTITPNPDDLLTANTAVTITIGTEVKGRYGNHLNTPAVISFNVSTDGTVVKNAYIASNVWAVHNQALYETQGFVQWGNYDRDRRLRLNTNVTPHQYEVTLYFGVQAMGEIDNDIEHDIDIVEVHYANLNGDEVSGPLGLEVETVNKGTMSKEVVEDGGAGGYYRSQYPNSGKLYKIVYRWAEPVQGIIRLVVVPSGVLAEAEDWQVLIAESRSFITVAFDNLAPGGTETAAFSGEASQSVEGNSSVYNYNSTDKTMTVNLNFRNIRDNYNNGVISYGNLNATGGKPRTMDAQSAVEWQWRIATGTTPNYTDNTWRSLIDNNGDPAGVISDDLSVRLSSLTTVRDVQVRYKDSLGLESGWETVGRVRYFDAPPAVAVTTWTATYNEGANNIGLTWTLPANMSGVEVSVNGGVGVDIKRTGTGTGAETGHAHTHPGVPRIYELGILNNQQVSNAAEYTISLTAYNDYNRAAPVVFKIWNIPGMMASNDARIIEVSEQAGLAAITSGMGRQYVLTSDIELTDWVLNSAANFTGRLFGNGHTITIKSLGTPVNNMGLFRVVSGAVIRDLRIVYDNVVITANGTTVRFGGVASRAEGETQIRNVIVEGSVSSGNLSSNTSAKYIGGILGEMSSDTASIANCLSNLDMDFINGANSVYFGGVVGFTSAVDSNIEVIAGVTVAGNLKLSDAGTNMMFAGGIIGLGYTRGSHRDLEFSGSLAPVKTSTGTTRIGGITGYSSGATTAANNCVYSNLRVSGQVTVPSSFTGNDLVYLGGLFGSINYTNVSDSWVRGDIRSDRNGSGDLFCGGLMGYATNSTVNNCWYEQGSVISDGQGVLYLGGGIGNIVSDTTVTNSYSRATLVSGSRTGISTVYVGGFIGFFQTGNLNGCYSTAEVRASGGGMVSAGGLIGCWSNSQSSDNYFTVSECYATGNVSGSTSSSTSSSNTNRLSVGGLIGYMGRTQGSVGLSVYHSYALGDVTADRKIANTTENTYAGGLIGLVYDDAAANTRPYHIRYNFARGAVSAKSAGTGDVYAGGLVGRVNVLSNTNSSLQNNAALGRSVTALNSSDTTNPADTRITGRIFGGSTAATAINYANEPMYLGTGVYSTAENPSTTPVDEVTPGLTNQHGANANVAQTLMLTILETQRSGCASQTMACLSIIQQPKVSTTLGVSSA